MDDGVIIIRCPIEMKKAFERKVGKGQMSKVLREYIEETIGKMRKRKC